MDNQTGNRTHTRTKEQLLYEFRYQLKKNRYWFLVSVAVCLVVAFLYLGVTPDVYQRTASILIKDESANNMSEVSAFEDLSMFKTGTNVNNEIKLFKSPHLIREVVKRLNLDIDYRLQKKLKTVALYSGSPVEVRFPDLQDHMSFSFELELLTDNLFRLYRFQLNGQSVDYDEVVAFSDSIRTPVGEVLVTPTFFYSENYYGVPIHIVKSKITDVVRRFTQETTVSLSGIHTTIINLSVKDESQQRADDYLNMLISVYNEQRIEDKSRIAVNTSEFINERLRIIEKELGGIDSDIETYKSSHLLTDVQAAGERFMSESSEYASKAFELNNQLSVARFIKEYMTEKQNLHAMLPSNSGIGNLNIEAQINDYNLLLLKRDNLMSNSSDQNPVVMEMNNSLNSMRHSLIRTIDNLLVTLDMQLSEMGIREAQVKRRIASNPRQEKHLTSIERQQKIKESLYLYLLQKREENELSKEITISNTRTVSPATGSDRPVAPHKPAILLAALVIGLIIPPSTLWLKEMLNHSIRGRNDITSTLSVPYIGDIPEVPKKMFHKANAGLLVVREQNRQFTNEAFHIVQSNMEFLYAGDRPLQVVLFTSLNPHSGKTFTSVNLAMSVAITGKRALVIDLDLRKATLSRHFNNPAYGIADYLSGIMHDPDDIIIHSAFHENMDVIPVGALPANPVELLLNGRLEGLLDCLRGKYDYIYIDCAPAEIVVDAAIVGKMVDLTVFVARKGLMERQLLPDVEALYKLGRFANMSILLNGFHHVSRYGNYYYGSTVNVSYGE